MWENQHQCCSSFQALTEGMKRVFDRAVTGREAARLLVDLCQGVFSVFDYSIEFCTLADKCNWNEEAQWDIFLHGLVDRIQKEIFMLELPTKLDDLITLHSPVMRSDQHDPEPMNVGRARLTREEKDCHRSRGLCLYCGAA